MQQLVRKDLPRLGVGIGYRSVYRADILWNRTSLPLLELTAEEFMGATGSSAVLEELDSNFETLVHGIEMSLGSAQPPDPDYLANFAELATRVRAPWVSEHLSFVRSAGVEIGHLTPIPATWEAVDTVVRNVRMLKERLDVPVLLENISSMINLPGEMTEWEFVTEVLERSGAGLLLDVTNLYTNAVNRDTNPTDQLAEIPMNRVIELHLAGGHIAEDYLIDSHSSPICEDVWELTSRILQQADVRAIIIERDTNYPPFQELLQEVDRARAMLESSTYVA